tara:strand:- start:479 stop:1531 length:1053 start_codon:yes stop_codon:yes gene_type:complete
MDFNVNNDDVESSGFIDKDKILSLITEERIFELVFGIQPKEYEYVTSPFREDENPNCWFEVDEKGTLRFIDYANPRIIKGIRMKSVDCFDAVMVYYNLSSFFKTLEFISDKLLKGKPKPTKPVVRRKPREKRIVEIFIKPRDFNAKDAKFWKAYEISRQNLIDDKVFAVGKSIMLNTKSGDYSKTHSQLSYAYTGFKDNRVKIYSPYMSKGKFLTNCRADDVGELDSLIDEDEILVISKSYKDCRVLKNQGLNSIWFQNEGMMPNDEILADLGSRFEYIIVFFDNDTAGIEAAKVVVARINSLYPGKSFYIHLPLELIKYKIKDPSDLIKEKGKVALIKFLEKNNFYGLE